MTSQRQPDHFLRDKRGRNWDMAALPQGKAGDDLIYQAITGAILTIYANHNALEATVQSVEPGSALWIRIPSMDCYMRCVLNARPGTLVRLASFSIIAERGYYMSQNQMQKAKADLVDVFQGLDGARRELLRRAYQRYLALKD